MATKTQAPPQIESPEGVGPTTEDPRDLEIRELKLKLKASEEERAASRDALHRMSAKVETLEATQVQPTEVDSKKVLKVGLHHNGVFFKPGTVCPFDPENPPPGCDGLVENVHWALRKF